MTPDWKKIYSCEVLQTMSGWRQGQQRKISAQKTAGGGEPQSQATGAVLFNKHGNIRQCNQAIASGRWTAAALRLRTARRQRRSFKETPCQVDGKLKPWWWWKRYNRAPAWRRGQRGWKNEASGRSWHGSVTTQVYGPPPFSCVISPYMYIKDFPEARTL